MAYNEKTAQRVRKALAAYPRVREHSMMGTLCFMVDDVMTCGVLGDDLFIRIGVDAMEPALHLDYAKPVLIRKRAMRAYVGVEPEGFRTAAQLKRWIERGLAAPKPAKAKGAKAAVPKAAKKAGAKAAVPKAAKKKV